MPIFSHGITRNKLLLLHLISSMPYAPTERQLYTILFETDSMPYFDFCEAMAQVQEDGYATAAEAIGGKAYMLTADGVETLALFVDSVPLSLREQVTAYEQAHREQLQDAAQYLSKMQEAPDGGYSVQLMAAEGDRVLFCMELSAATREIATRMRKNWSAACPQLYQATLAALLND